MILYLDSSAVVPLLIDEYSSARCRDLWDAAGRVATTRLTYVEVAAALGAAERSGRLTRQQETIAREHLDAMWSEFEVVEFEESLMIEAAVMAKRHSLRGYDAVQCASALRLRATDLVAAAGDHALLHAWAGNGLAVADVAGG